MTKEQFEEVEHEANAHTPIPMSHQIKKLTNKDLLDIVEQERREQEAWQCFDAFYPLSYVQHKNY